MHYLFNELAIEGIHVDYNIFCEKHGKNSRDQHFSIISNFIKQESHLKKITSSQEIVDAIHKHQEFSNRSRKNKIVTKAFVLEKNDQSICSIRQVENLKTYYNFFNDENFNFKSRIISDLKIEKKIIFIDQIKPIIDKNEKIIPEKKIENEVCNITNLKKKNFLIRLNQRSKKRFLNKNSPTHSKIISKSLEGFCKKNCYKCETVTNFEIEDFEHELENFSLQQLNQELKNHGHAKFKKINGKNRNIEQAKDELKYHLLKFHFK